MKSRLRTFLWFADGLDEALKFYQETFTDVVIHSENRPDPSGPLFTAEFSIYGHSLLGMQHPGAPQFNDSISLSIVCDGQEETDRLWDAITQEGSPGRCGWCKDKWGVSWQVTPMQMMDYLGNSDPEIRQYANEALMKMDKIVIRDFYR